ncbi:MAG: 30S ribosomal protein S18 [Candidatus Calescibacterium sp.]|nr:30S ribosomal protein S18 [Candidatus Calescibacterium sp.]MCX7734551.1 30S ribosomal protein S18 [bacterium]MDW8087625.1 30S ribosomal protein S18 [Candidatus Calescibacterium sp.]
MVVKSKPVCKICTGEQPPLTYRNPEFLAQFLTEKGMIKSRKTTNFCPKCQRRLAREIKRARILALLPFTTLSLKLSPKELIEYFGEEQKQQMEEEEVVQ